MAYYFVVRTDLPSDSGSQRCFGVFDDEPSASEFAIRITGQYMGEFAVVGPAPIAVSVVRRGGPQPVVAIPVESE